MVNKKFRFVGLLACLLAAVFLSACASGGADDKYYFAEKEQVTMSQAYTGGEVSFSQSLWSEPSVMESGLESILGENALLETSDSRIRPILYKGVSYGGRQTEVFAYVGFPEGASEDNPVPGVVLVHGGEGTAFWDWVQMWLDKGYAAIAMDTEGRFPTVGSEMATGYRALLPEDIRGPQNSGYYADASSEPSEQWMYHAVASVIAANSYLRSCPQVDADSIGMVGVSWGGVICSIANIYDDRFAFAAPIYGTLNMAGTSCNFGNIYAASERAASLWDNGTPLSQCSTFLRQRRRRLSFQCAGYLPLRRGYREFARTRTAHAAAQPVFGGVRGGSVFVCRPRRAALAAFYQYCGAADGGRARSEAGRAAGRYGRRGGTALLRAGKRRKLENGNAGSGGGDRLANPANGEVLLCQYHRFQRFFFLDGAAGGIKEIRFFPQKSFFPFFLFG